MLVDFSRQVHCLLGLPFDMVGLDAAEQRIRAAVANRSSCFLSTPNLNFVISAQSDREFRNSVIDSDLSMPDGMPLVWIAPILGMPLEERVAGSDLFNKLRKSTERMSVYFFGGLEGVAELACRRLNGEHSGLVCVGFEYPGFASVEEMSDDRSIQKINASGADFLVVSLGAKKGQAWIQHNRDRLAIPAISHLGAVVNFISGNVTRAPIWMQRNGLEWLWRIKEEPALWRRYASDGLVFCKLLFTRVLPCALFMFVNRPSAQDLKSARIELSNEQTATVIRLTGAWAATNLAPLRDCFSREYDRGIDIRLDLEQVSYVDSAFLGLLILLYGGLHRHGKRLLFSRLSKNVQKILHYACADYLLDAEASRPE
jgi:N-acetylglucosaminyldiphosphoundecaprenol N-acetyl-beta-D-mannosaminyltransferase